MVSKKLPARDGRPVVLVGGGVVDSALLIALAPHVRLVGLDGGGNTILAAELVPEMVIGDGDSFIAPEGVDLEGLGTELVVLSDQNSTDFDKALRTLSAPYFVALGVLGDRLDHGFASLSSLMRPPVGTRVLLIGRDDAVRYVARPHFSVSIPADTRVSIVTLAPVRFIESTGLAYPLTGLILAPGGQGGTSNRASADRVTIIQESTGSGYFLICPAAAASALLPKADPGLADVLREFGDAVLS